MIEINKHALFIALALAVCAAAHVQAKKKLYGELTEEKPANDRVRKVVSHVKDDIRKKWPKEIESIKSISYRSELTAGTMYYVKAQIIEKGGDKPYAHLRIYEKHSAKGIELIGLKTNVTETTKLEKFVD